MKRLFIALCLSLTIFFINAQGVTTTGRATGQPAFPLKEYSEMPNPKCPNPDEWKNLKTLAIELNVIDRILPEPKNWEFFIL